MDLEAFACQITNHGLKGAANKHAVKHIQLHFAFFHLEIFTMISRAFPSGF